jgi:hypothetical protein
MAAFALSAGIILRLGGPFSGANRLTTASDPERLEARYPNLIVTASYIDAEKFLATLGGAAVAWPLCAVVKSAFL